MITPKLVSFAALAVLAAPAAAQVTQLGSTLRVDMGSGTHNVVVTVGETFSTVAGVPGHNASTRFFGVSALDYIGDTGRDTVTVNMTITSDFSLSFNTGNGGSSVQVTATLPRGMVDLDIDSIHGSGRDTLDLLVNSDASMLGVDWSLDGGAGPVDLTGMVISSNPTTSLDVVLSGRLGSGSDTAAFDVISAAASPALLVDLTTINGVDDIDITWDQQWLASVSAIVSAELGNGPDDFKFTFNGLSSASDIALLGLVRGQTGSDVLELDLNGDASTVHRMSGNNGADIITLTVEGDHTGTSTPRGGAGGDTFNYSVTGTDSSLTLVNGGRGLDTCNGTVATVSCETINP